MTDEETSWDHVEELADRDYLRFDADTERSDTIAEARTRYYAAMAARTLANINLSTTRRRCLIDIVGDLERQANL